MNVSAAVVIGVLRIKVYKFFPQFYKGKQLFGDQFASLENIAPSKMYLLLKERIRFSSPLRVQLSELVCSKIYYSHPLWVFNSIFTTF